MTAISEGQGKSTERIVSLPAVVAESGEKVLASRRTAGGKQRCREALISDAGSNAADSLAMFFRMEGMETAVAYDGDEAVKIAKSFEPDLILMDLGMPVMSGYEAAGLMRHQKKDIVLVALSGWGQEEDRRRSSEA